MPIEVSGYWNTLEKEHITTQEILKIEGKRIVLNDLERMIWPNFSKAQLIQFYASMSPFLLPFLKDRPLALNISPRDPDQSFVIKSMDGRAPDWATVYKSRSNGTLSPAQDKIEWLVCNDFPTLYYILNLNCIDIHTWSSRTSSPQNPDYLFIGINPGDDFNRAIETALAARRVFDQYGLKSFIKTSGKKGLHLLIPCDGINYKQSRLIASKLCRQIQQLLPTTTTSVHLNSPGELLYLDASRNNYSDRIASPYCPRAYHLPTVSTPLDWNEVVTGLNPEAFTVFNLASRVQEKGDLWQGLLQPASRDANGRALLELS